MPQKTLYNYRMVLGPWDEESGFLEAKMREPRRTLKNWKICSRGLYEITAPSKKSNHNSYRNLKRFAILRQISAPLRSMSKQYGPSRSSEKGSMKRCLGNLKKPLQKLRLRDAFNTSK